ncbi:MAG: hypothetical protein ABIK72_07270 [candidate division WOR-3 bacterium]
MSNFLKELFQKLGIKNKQRQKDLENFIKEYRELVAKYNFDFACDLEINRFEIRPRLFVVDLVKSQVKGQEKNNNLGR